MRPIVLPGFVNPYPVTRCPVLELKNLLHLSAYYRFFLTGTNVNHGLLQRGNTGV